MKSTVKSEQLSFRTTRERKIAMINEQKKLRFRKLSGFINFLWEHYLGDKESQK